VVVSPAAGGDERKAGLNRKETSFLESSIRIIFFNFGPDESAKMKLGYGLNQHLHFFNAGLIPDENSSESAPIFEVFSDEVS